MRTSRLLVTMGLASIAITPGFAGDLYRVRIDLDGDRKPEIIEIVTATEKQEWRSQAIVKVGTAKYVAEFFSAESDIPGIQVIAIDRKRPQRQLLLETPEASTCIYHVLSYVKGTLVQLLRFDSGPSCQAPQPLGNGQVSVSTWWGFWAKEDRYRLSPDGRTLVQEPTPSYRVEIAGVVGKPLLLEGAECPARLVQPGTYVKVKLYDSKDDRYRLQTSDGSCGWIPATDLNTIDQVVKDLPWAG